MKNQKILPLFAMLCLALNACVSSSEQAGIEPLSFAQQSSSDFNGQWNGYVQMKIAQGSDSIEVGGTFPLVFSKDSLTVPLGVFNEKYFDGTLVKCRFSIDPKTNILTILNPKSTTAWGNYAANYQYVIKKMPDLIIANVARTRYKLESLNLPTSVPSTGRMHRWDLTKFL
jgi:ABC-type Fe3+-hydroxamate transport system substrate-binding protein